MIPIRALTSRRALLGLALATGLAGHVLSQEAPAPSPSAPSQEAAVQALPGAQAVQAFILEQLRVTGQKAGDPGLVVLVARGEQVLAEVAMGQASVELGVPLQPSQVFRLGSVTKQFAAAAVLKLVDEGRIELQAPVSRYLPGYPGGGQFTVLQLLNHTAGVSSYTSFDGYMGGDIRLAKSTDDMIQVFAGKTDFPAGTQWRYSNSGYVLVGALVEKVSGRPWHEDIRERLLRPAGITEIAYPGEAAVVAGHVQGYSVSKDGALQQAMPLSMTQPHAAGALLGSARALWQWNRLLHEGGLLSPASYQAMVTPEGAAKAQRYGLGLVSEPWRGRLTYQHSGGIPGFSTQLAYQPDTRTTVVVLANSDSPTVQPGLLARRVMAMATGRPYPGQTVTAPDPGLLTAAAGIYVNAKGEERRFHVDGQRLVATRAQGRPLPLDSMGGGRFGSSRSTAVFHFLRDAQGRVGELVLYPDGDGQGERWTRQP